MTEPVMDLGTGQDIVAAASKSLTINPDQEFWTPAQRAAVLAMANLAPDTPNAILGMFFHNCQATGLDPFRREVYLIGRGKREKKYTIQTGIDGFLHIAEDTGAYQGIEGPYWCGEDGQWVDVWVSKIPPVAARAGVRRKDHEAVTWGTAVYDEFVPMEEVYEGTYPNRKPTGRYEPAAMWKKMPSNQLAKCAIAQAVRKAFPRRTAGLYVNEEMDAADATERNETRREEAAAATRQTAGQAWRTGDAQVVEGEVIEEDIATLRAEVERIASVLSTSPARLSVQMSRMLRKGYDQFTAREVAALIQSYRSQVPPEPVREPDTTVDRDDPGGDPSEEELAAAYEAEMAETADRDE